MALDGNDTVKHANDCVSSTIPVSVFRHIFFLTVTLMVIELNQMVRGTKLGIRSGGLIALRSANMTRHQGGI